MRTPSRGSSSRRSGHCRIADFLDEDMESDNESFKTAYDGSDGLLPMFLNDQNELVEVMLELDEESMVVRTVTPTSATLYSAMGATTPEVGPGQSPSRCSSTSSRIRKKFAWLRSPSPCRPSAAERDAAAAATAAALAAREKRRVQARLNRTRSGAQRALKGLRFISRTTNTVEAAELWQRVEERFYKLAKDGLLSREDFGECIGVYNFLSIFLPLYSASFPVFALMNR
jgi:respiratory burst oxidase